MSKRRVLVTGTSIRPDLLAPLAAAGLEIRNPRHTLSEDELAAALADACAYLKGGGEQASARALAGAKALKLIAFFGMGYESSIDVAAAKAAGIAITVTKGALSDAMADLTLGLILSSLRRIHPLAQRFAEGGAPDLEKRRDLRSRQVGIVGLGGSGVRIAEVLRQGFGAPVRYASRTRKPAEEARLGIAFAPLDELMAWSDVLVVIAAGNAETWGLIGAEEIARARPGQILVNVARPRIVAAEALLNGLRGGPLSYAAFDGFYDGPADVVAALRALMPEKLMATPHIGSLTHEARDAMARMAVASILTMLETGDDPNRVA